MFGSPPILLVSSKLNRCPPLPLTSVNSAFRSSCAPATHRAGQCPAARELAPVSPFLATLTSDLQLPENKTTLSPAVAIPDAASNITPLFATLTKNTRVGYPRLGQSLLCLFLQCHPLTPLQSALTKNTPITRLESALTRKGGRGPCVDSQPPFHRATFVR
jgi:hypothetical protein